MSAPAWLTARPIAHRGFHDEAARRIENTLPAAEAAIERRFAIECDLQLTADGRPIVFHDDKLDRLTETMGFVKSRTRAELRAVKFRHSDAAIPTLEDLLDLVAGRVPLIVELKSHFNGDRRLEQATAKTLAGYKGEVAVMSFDPASMTAMRRLAPALPRGILADRFRAADWPDMPPPKRVIARSLLTALAVVPTFIAYDVNDLPARIPLALRRFFRLPLLTWTVKTEAHRATAKACADQIIFEGFDPDAA